MAYSPRLLGNVPPQPSRFAEKLQKTGDILAPYVTGPFDAFWRLMNSPAASGGQFTEQNAGDALTAGGSAMLAGSVVPKPANALMMGARTPKLSFADDMIERTKIGDSNIVFRKTPDGNVELYSLRTPAAKRGKGSAKAAMTDFLTQVDENGFGVKLDASPLDKKTNIQRLVSFYESLGFQKTGKSNNAMRDPEMYRPPTRTHKGGR